MKTIGVIYEESDYTKFKRLPDNRDVLSARVNKLIASMTEKYILNPIAVNENMEVVDGQGRFEARKAMGLPIHYYIAKGANSDDCRRMNKYNTSWSQLDFAKSWASSGRQAYARLLKTTKETGLSISSVLRLANRGQAHSKSKDIMSPYERGDLNYTVEDMELVKKVKSLSDEILTALTFSGRVNDAFRTGCKVMFETPGYDHERMIQNCRVNRASFAQMSNLGNQLKEFERIYNKGIRGSNKLYFSDYMRNKGANVRDYSKTHSPYQDRDVSTLN